MKVIVSLNIISFNRHASECLPLWDIVRIEFVHPEVRKENSKRLILSWTGTCMDDSPGDVSEQPVT